MREQRRIAAIVSADVAGYSRLMGRDESGTLATLKVLRREIVDPPIAAHGGQIGAFCCHGRTAARNFVARCVTYA